LALRRYAKNVKAWRIKGVTTTALDIAAAETAKTPAYNHRKTKHPKSKGRS